MEIQTKQFITTLQEEKYQTITVKLTKTDITNMVLKKVTAAYSQLEKALQAGKISQIKIDLPFEVPATIELQAGIINLPYELVDKIKLLTNAEDQAVVNLYLITTADNLNASGMRIDEMSSVAEFLAQPQVVSKKIDDEINQKITELKAATKDQA
ncbi:hypothetical protein [Loigolactobacillus rennini]|uniref:Uncharacterized protein n=1 Tax=Loigolactobacillus rennini DSM 20253 TaxID=1423796 RepID=A0A0R2CZZ1_9LACO|nr:hypothetical protein [Loigolactobacillus rennini]KRM97341.1 hypothetical protein FC24_GL001599 [Loigolactobacillus rennini DSM 20253]